MGSAEGTMRVFVKRLKNGRSWCKNGITKLTNLMVAFMDKRKIRTSKGIFNSSLTLSEPVVNQPKFYKEKLVNQVRESTRNNLSYLQQSINSPIVRALRGLKGY